LVSLVKTSLIFPCVYAPCVCGRGEVHTGLEWGNLREGDHLEDPGVDGRIILK
jgi:hypothetical protein